MDAYISLRVIHIQRLDGANPFGDSLFTPRNWTIVDELKRVAAEAGESSVRVALAWVCGRPGVASTLMGVSRIDQISDNSAALQVKLSAVHRAALDAVSASGEPRMLYSLFTPALRRQVIFGGCSVEAQIH
jgi:aryl-alcohol dehydrogenase-like predicted oxidoreductase